MDMNARSYPRTLEGAFGPYHRSSVCPIQPMPPTEAERKAASIAVWASLAIGFVAALAACFFS